MKKSSNTVTGDKIKGGHLGQFRTLSEILQYLTAQGRQISMSTLKKHSMRRRLPRQGDGTWTLKDVDTYGYTLPTVPAGAAPAAASVAARKTEAAPAEEPAGHPSIVIDVREPSASISQDEMDSLDAADLARLKLQKEIGRLDAQTRGLVFDNDVKAGRFWKKSEVLLEFATRTAVLYQGLRQDLLAAVPDVVRAGVNGETAMRQAVERALDSAVNQFSRPLNLTLDLADAQATAGDIDESA